MTDPVAVLPLGATEQHGPHLPPSTDCDIGLGILEAAFRALPRDFPAYAMPIHGVGCSREHARFPGTEWIEPEVLIATIMADARILAHAGVRRMVLANSHGGNKHAMEEAALRVREKHGMLVVKASWFRFPRPDGVALPEAEWKHGLHAGAVETAMMLHLKPELVRMERATEGRSLGHELEKTMTWLGPEGVASFGWLAGDLSVAGAVGDARLASAAMGERLVAHYGRVLAEVIQDARAFPIEALA
jgi:creatinine amidohydrolase